MVCFVPLCSAQTDTVRAQQLLQEIKTGTNIGDPLKELTLLAQSNPDVKAYLSNQLPNAIVNKQNPTAWRAEVQLVGDLQLVTAIPQLVKLLIVDTEDLSPTGAYRSMTMTNNPPARALISIGDPAVPAVTALLQSEDRTTRSRAIRVLININTTGARSALSQDAATEKDPALLRLIERHAIYSIQNVQSAHPKHPVITANLPIVVSGSTSAFETLIHFGIDNQIPLGIVIDQNHRICQFPIDRGTRTMKLSEFVEEFNSKLPGYRAVLQSGILNIYPTELALPTKKLLDLKIPEFHSGPDSHQGLGVNLWMFIRAVIAPSEGSAFVGGDSTTRETVSGIQLNGQTVSAILNHIVDKGGGAAWVLHSSVIKGLSPATKQPYEIYGYSGEETLLKQVDCFK